MKKSIGKGWENWKALSKRIGRFQARIFFSILYYLIVTPLGLVMGKTNRLLVRDEPQWEPYVDAPQDLAQMKEQ